MKPANEPKDLFRLMRISEIGIAPSQDDGDDGLKTVWPSVIARLARVAGKAATKEGINHGFHGSHG